MNKLVLYVLAAAASPVAFASTVAISFVSLPAMQGNGTTNSQGNTYVGEIGATIAGIPNQELVCDDFDATTYIPSSNIDFSVETISSLAGVNFTNGYAMISGNTLTEAQAYETAAVLLTDLEALPVTSGNAQAIADYQYAIWNLMQPSGVDGSDLDSPLDSNASGDQQTAYAAVLANSTSTQIDEKGLVIYTPTAPYASNQEFLGMNTPTAPEPSSWVLMASFGMLLCVPRLRFRLRSELLPRK